MSVFVDSALQKEYSRAGVVHLRNVFERKWISLIRSGLDRVLAHPGPLSISEYDEANNLEYVSDMFSAALNSQLRDFVLNSPASRIAGEIMDAEHINFFYDHSFLRDHGSSHLTEWHNDKAYWPVVGEKLCTIWVPVQDVAVDSGALEYVIGSHNWNLSFKDGFYPRFANISAQGLDPDRAIVRVVPKIDEHRDAFEIKLFELQVGDCLVHHPLVLHSSPAIRTNASRWAYATRWAGEDVRYFPRIDTQRALYDPGLAPGSKLDCELFPRTWNRLRPI